MKVNKSQQKLRQFKTGK